MKKTITGIFWIAVLSITPALSMENDKGAEKQRVFCKSQRWENGKMVWEKIEYVPADAPKSIQPSGKGTWKSTAMNTTSTSTSTTTVQYLLAQEPTRPSGMGAGESMILDTPIQYPSTKKAISLSGRGAWESTAMSPIVQDSPTTVYDGQNGGW